MAQRWPRSAFAGVPPQRSRPNVIFLSLMNLALKGILLNHAFMKLVC